jgi:hypothetical protein
MSTRIFFISIMIIIITSCSGAGTTIRDHAVLGFYSSPEEVITTLEKGEKGAPEYFMLGGLQEKKDYKKALFNFANSCFRSHHARKMTLYAQPIYSFITGFHLKSAYYEDALYEIAGLLYSYQEYPFVEKILRRIGNDNRGLYCESRLLLARALQMQKRESEAISLLNEEILKAPNDSMRHKYLIRRASIQDALGLHDKAAEDYLGITRSGIESWQSGVAASEILRLLDQNLITLTTRDRELTARALFHAGKYEEAAGLLAQVIAAPDGETATAGNYLVRSLVRLKKDREADAFIANHEKNLRPALLEAQADELWISGRRGGAIALYRNLLKSGDDERKKTALGRIALELAETGRNGHVALLEQYIQTYPDSENTHQMLWLLGRHYLKSGDSTRARAALESALEKLPDGKYSDQCRFWLYKILKKSGDSEGSHKMAVDILLRNPDSPYTFLAIDEIRQSTPMENLTAEFDNSIKDGKTGESLYLHSLLYSTQRDIKRKNERLARLDPSLKADHARLASMLANVQSGTFADTQLAQLEKYVALGYSEGIERVMAILKTGGQSEAEKNITMAWLGGKYGSAFHSVFYTQQLLKELGIRENIFLMPDQLVRMILPMPFRDCVSRYSAQYGIDPNSVYSLIKAESLFNSRVRSSAGAVGLMQLMPGTAGDIAKKTGIDTFDLENPCTSIHFGIHYLGWLKGYLKDNFVYMVAAYNAGAGNVNKWKKRLPENDMDYFTEFVPFRKPLLHPSHRQIHPAVCDHQRFIRGAYFSPRSFSVSPPRWPHPAGRVSSQSSGPGIRTPSEKSVRSTNRRTGPCARGELPKPPVL